MELFDIAKAWTSELGNTAIPELVAALAMASLAIGLRAI